LTTFENGEVSGSAGGWPLKSVRENRVVPPGRASFLPLSQRGSAGLRWDGPFGAGSVEFLPTEVLENQFSRALFRTAFRHPTLPGFTEC